MKKIKNMFKTKNKKDKVIEIPIEEEVEELEEEKPEEKIVIENITPVPEMKTDEVVIELDARGRLVKPKVHARGRFPKGVNT